MADDFNPDNAIAVQDNAEGTQAVSDTLNIDNAVPVDAPHTGQTPYDQFKAVKTSASPDGQPAQDNAPESAGTQKKAVSKDVPRETVQGPSQYPDEGMLNAVVHTAQGAAWNMVAKPILGMKDPDMDKYLSDIEKQHPIASTIGGTAPYIASSFLFPESLIPHLYARMAVQFGAVGGLSAIGHERVNEAMKPLPAKIGTVAAETAKGAAFSPIWAKAQELQFIGRPFATALARAGVIGAGSSTMSTFFGSNVTEAFKQGGILAALSLISEGPHLGKTVIGRGIVNHANSIYADMAVKSGLPEIKMDPDSPGFPGQLVDVTKGLAKQIKGIDQPQIVAATIKLPDGTEVHGASHEDALEKIGLSKGTKEPYEAGFTVMDPNGKTRFITREESMKDPFNLPRGHSEDVKGLNESKFLAPPEELKIVNPDTLKLMGESGQMDVNMIPGVAETAEVLSRSGAELKEKLRPYSMGEEGKYTATVLREQLGILARANDQTEQAHLKAKQFFDKATQESITETYTMAERGEKQDTPELQKIYDTLQKELKDEADNVRALGTGKLEEAIENYLPHVWESPKKAQNILGQIFGRRPFEGPKSFLKKRTINDFSAGIEAGLTPVSWNPVDLTMIKLREMRKYVMAQKVKQALKEQGLRVFVKVGQKSPDGWVKIKDNAEDVYKSPMIAIQEAFDEHVMNKLEDVAKNLNINLERKVNLRGRELGSSQRGPEAPEDPASLITDKALPGKVKTKFASPESVLAHEIGHQIDEMYNLKQMFLSRNNDMIIDNKIAKVKKNEAMSAEEKKDAIKNLKFEKLLNKEFQTLADLRFEGKEDVASKGFKNYVRKGSEKMAVMLEAYIHAPEKFKEAAPNVYKAFDNFIKVTPELKPLSDIKPSLVLGTREGEVYAGGNVISGHYYTQPDAARIIDNHLSPGLQGKSYIYDMYRGAGNTLNQFQLGISAFHLGFTSMDATISKFALGINKLSTGDFAGAIKEFGKAPFAPITNIMQGRELLQSWYGKDNGPLTNTIADLMAAGGGRAKMDKFYATGARDSMQKALKEGKILTGALKVPFYIVEQVARPIMEYIVPRQKMGVFMDMMKMEMEKNPNMTHSELRGVAQKAWDSVDNRMGQMVYDNLFWSRTVKDLGMASVRSLGWNLGTIREIGGGTKDVIGNVNDIIHGKGTKLSYRTAYVMALPIVTGLYGAIYQYLHTGKGPEELRDYFFPKNGAIDNKGNEARISLPTYMKDLYHYTTNPVQTVINKFSPVNNTVLEMLYNKDFYGVQIRNADDPIMQQVLDEAKFMSSQFVPFGFRNLGRDTRTGAASKVEPFIGITPAPYDVNMTKAEREAYELSKAKIPVGSRTKEQAQHSQEKSKLRSQFMADKDTGILTQAVADKVISAKEKKEIIKESKMSSLQRLTEHLTLEEVASVLKKSTPDERPELERILKKKKQGKSQRGTLTQAEEDLYARSFNTAE